MTLTISGVALSGLVFSPVSLIPTLSDPSTVNQNTTVTNSMGADGYTWAQTNSLTVDKYGHLFAITEDSANPAVHWLVFSNDNGATWSDSSFSQGFITRGALAYDSVNDIVHVLWECQVPTDGILYRRYTITRDGSHNITDFSRDTSVNLQLDYQTDGTMTYQFPSMIWMNDAAFGTYGALLCAWSAKNGLNVELRSSMRVLTNDSNDNTASNWKYPVSSSSTTIGNAPQVPYTAIYARNSANSMQNAILRKRNNTHALDVMIVYYDGNSLYAYTRAQWNSSSHDWSTGLTSPATISNVLRSGTDSGYNVKWQLISKIAEDSNNDRIFVGMATWKDNANGDTWSYTYIDSADVIHALVDVYSAGGAHSYAPTGDITFDDTLNALAVSYIKTSTQSIYAQAFQGATQIQSEILAENSYPCDIPLLYYANGAGRINNKLPILYRDTNSPKKGHFTTLDWS